MTGHTTVETSPIRKDALDKVTGRAKYTADYFEPGMLFSKIVKSPYPHARIKKIDSSNAEKVPGIKTVVKPEDIPDIRIGNLLWDMQLLPNDGIARYIGAPIAIVVGDNQEIVEEALDLVEVEYEELPAVFDVEEAMEENPIAVIHPDKDKYFAAPIPNVRRKLQSPNVFHRKDVIRGDVDKAFEEADLIVENRFVFNSVQHAPLERHIADAWLESDGTIFIRHATAGAYHDIHPISMLFNYPRSKIRVQAPYVGGAFGGKGFPLEAYFAAAAALKLKNRKPVRYECSRDEVFTNCGRRPRVIAYVKDGVKKDGTIIARDVKAIIDAGAYSAFGSDIAGVSMDDEAASYKIPNYKFFIYVAYTNNPPASPFRGVGGPEINWGLEQQVDIVADRLGLDPLDVRRKNLVVEGDKELHNRTIGKLDISGCMEKAAEWIAYDKKPEAEGPWRKGKGVAIGIWYGCPIWPATAEVEVMYDGGVKVIYGDSEIGQGSETILAQLAAEEFKVPLEQVELIWGDTQHCPPCMAAVGSRTTFYGGNAILNACRDAKRQIFELAAPRLKVSVDELTMADGAIYEYSKPDKRIHISELFIPPFQFIPKTGRILGRGEYFYPPGPIDPKTGENEIWYPCEIGLSYGVEVAVNIETGEVKLLKLGTCADIGRVVNQKTWEGQVEGGFTMGLGTVLYEQIVLDHGNILNPNLVDYKIPKTTEVPDPENLQTSLTLGIPEPRGPLGAKPGGEMVLIPMAPAVGQAVRNAIGVTIREAPITREAILKAIRKKNQKEK